MLMFSLVRYLYELNTFIVRVCNKGYFNQTVGHSVKKKKSDCRVVVQGNNDLQAVRTNLGVAFIHLC